MVCFSAELTIESNEGAPSGPRKFGGPAKAFIYLQASFLGKKFLAYARIATFKLLYN